MTEFLAFIDWAAVQAYVKSGARVYYQAPMDYRPVPIRARVKADGRIAVLPPSSDVDPFVADAGHLARFRRPAGGAR